MINKRLLGERLIEKKLIEIKELESALKHGRETATLLGESLVAQEAITEDELYPVLSEHLDIPYIKLSKTKIGKETLDALTPELAHRYGILPVKREDGALWIATSKPGDLPVLDELKLLLGCDIRPFLAKQPEIDDAIKRYYGLGSETLHRLSLEDTTPETSRVVLQDIGDLTDEASVIRLVNQVLYDAYRNRATDIHFEPYEKKFRIRYRIDGLLYAVPVASQIKKFQDAIISRIKIMASLNIAEKRLPQDGRIRVRIGDEDLNLRVSILPTPFGESVQVRLLSTSIFKLSELGLYDHEMRTVENVINKPHGIMFVTGPTGSGKTTTLYACLHKLNTDDRKIITIEDPIEYQLEGIAQIQIHPGIGLTFAQGLRSMLRHDPDVMMVGEVRDSETAEIAIKVALTGHLVLSTIHTNDAAGAVTRLLDMGIEPYLISSSVECIVAQRLVRVLCPHCKVEEKLSPHILREAGLDDTADFTAYAGRGCEKCKHTGYWGRTGIHEIIPVNDDIRELILKRAPANEIRKLAVSQGMSTLRMNGFDKVRNGITTISEVLKVTQEI